MYSNLFLTDKVHRLLMSALYDHFTKKYKYEIGPEEEQLASEIMKHNFQKTPAQRGEPPKQYIQKLMKICMRDLVQYIAGSLQKKQDEYKNRIASNEDLKSRPAMGNNQDVTNSFEQMNKERNQHLEDAKQKANAIPQFAL